jgi:hypothetical protein
MNGGRELPFRAILATLAFAGAGILAFILVPQPWELKAPNAFFYSVLVLNTFFSIRFFDALPPKNRDERVIDTVLTVLYLGLAAAIGSLVPFAILAMLLFLAATAKYVFLLPVMPDRRDLLMRKISIDALGLAMCVVALLVALLADPLWSAWAMAVVFAAANVYLLAISPMYVDRPAQMQEARQAAPLVE